MSTPAVTQAIIGGTGLSTWFGEAIQQQEVNTPYGKPSGAISCYRASEGGALFAFLPRHGSPHVIPPHKINYRANIRALQQLGVQQVIAVNAVGGIRSGLSAGTLVVPDQLVDYTYGREHTFSDGSEASSLQHIDFSYPFDQALRGALSGAANAKHIPVFEGGVYGVVQGPRLETAAEINQMESDGCDLVGMTAMPEAALARESGLAYASLCLVVNPAAGRGEGQITMEDIQRVLDEGMIKIREILVEAILSLQAD